MRKLALAITLLASTQFIACAHNCCGGHKETCKMEKKETCSKCHDEKCDGKNCGDTAKGGCPDCKDKKQLI